MKLKIIVVTISVLTALTAAVSIQTAVTRQILTFAVKKAAGHGIVLKDFHFQSAGFASPATLRWENLKGEVCLHQGQVEARDRVFDVHVQQLDVSLCSFQPPVLRIKAQGIQMVSKVLAETLRARAEKPERIVHGIFEVRFPCSIFNLRKARRQAGTLFNHLLILVRYGKAPLPFHFEAVALFEIRRVSFEARILSEKQKNQTFLRMPRQDLLKISAVLEESLTDDEVRILSERPMLAPQLLQIRNNARHTAYVKGKQNKQIPKDAYRHILWSYLLTREFGEVFSKEVTDAHEKNSVLVNTKAQHAMDYNNNAIGRHYAKRHYSEVSILTRLMKDPAVIRYSK